MQTFALIDPLHYTAVTETASVSLALPCSCRLAGGWVVSYSAVFAQSVRVALQGQTQEFLSRGPKN